MSDLVERLRYLNGSADDRVLTREAADWIEELEARIEGLEFNLIGCILELDRTKDPHGNDRLGGEE